MSAIRVSQMPQGVGNNKTLATNGSGVWGIVDLSSLGSGTPAWSSITSKPTTLSGYGITDPIVLTSGTYSNPAWITSLAYAKLTGAPSLATVATSGAYADLTGKPSLATVATTGDYTDLSNKPTIPTVTGTNTGDETTTRINALYGYTPADAATVATNTTSIATNTSAITELTGKTPLGTLITTIWTASDPAYTAVGSPTVSYSSSGLTLSGGVDTYAKGLKHSYTTVLENSELIAEFVPSVDGSGFAIGYESVASYAGGSTYARINLSAVTNRGQLTITNSVAGFTATSSNNLSFTTGVDRIRLTLRRTQNGYECIALNMTDNSTARVSYANNNNSGTSVNLGGVANPAIYAYGGTQVVKSLVYYSSTKKKPKLLFIGDSILSGGFSGGVNNRYANHVSSHTKEEIVVLGAKGAGMNDLNALQTEVGLISPAYLVIAAGVNDANASVSTSTYIGYVNSMISYCVSHNIIPIIMEVLPKTGSNTNIDAYNTAINLLKYRIIAVNATLKSAGVLAAAYDSGDGLHPNATGHFEVAQKIISSTTDILEYDYAYNSVNAPLFFRASNPNTGTSASVRYEQVTDNGLSVIQTSSSTNSFTSWTNRLAIANSTGGVTLSAYGASGTIKFQTGGFTDRGSINSTGKWRIGDGTSATEVLEVVGNIQLTTAGNKLKITEGTNGSVGQTTLVAGTKAITISGVTTSTRAIVTFVSVGGTVTTTWQYKAVCTSNTLTITAIDNTGATNTSDTSVLNYFIIN